MGEATCAPRAPPCGRQGALREQSRLRAGAGPATLPGAAASGLGQRAGRAGSQ